MPMPRLRHWVNFYTTELVGWTIGQVADHVSLGLGHVKKTVDMLPRFYSKVFDLRLVDYF